MCCHPQDFQKVRKVGSDINTQWLQHSVQVREQFQLPRDYRPWTTAEGAPSGRGRGLQIAAEGASSGCDKSWKTMAEGAPSVHPSSSATKAEGAPSGLGKAEGAPSGLGRGLNPRAREILDIAWACRLKTEARAARREGRMPKAAPSLRHNFWADISQSVSRKPWGEGVSTLCQNSVIYSFELDRVLPPQAHLRLQGWPRDAHLEGVPKASLREMAGEAFFLPTVCAALWAMVLTPDTPWWCAAEKFP